MENFTSPAARIPYPGINEITQEIGLTIVMKVIIDKHNFALAGSIPANIVIGLVRTKTSRQLAITTASASHDSFFM